MPDPSSRALMHPLGLLDATRSWSGTERQRNGETVERPAQQAPDNHAVRAEPEYSRSVADVIDRLTSLVASWSPRHGVYLWPPWLDTSNGHDWQPRAAGNSTPNC